MSNTGRHERQLGSNPVPVARHMSGPVAAVMLVLVAPLALSSPTVAMAGGTTVAAVPPPATITALCATDTEYLWKVSSDEVGLPYYRVQATPDPTDWSSPRVVSLILDRLASGGRAGTVWTAQSDGSSLSVRWWQDRTVVTTTTTTSWSPCAMATLKVTQAIEGGTATADQFPVSATRLPGAAGPYSEAQTTETPVATDRAQTVQPGRYEVGHTRDAASTTGIPLPAGYVWRSSRCDVTDASGRVIASSRSQPGSSAARWDERHGGVVAPGGTLSCTLTYHYGPVLTDTLVLGKYLSGTAGLVVGQQSPSVRTTTRGSYVTYVALTRPNLAGRQVQVWVRSGVATAPWALAAAVTVASDGTVRYIMRVTTATWFQARWPGDATIVASAADGAVVRVQ